jgi:RNA polymerase sigma-70 factor (ECF subfamily)
MVIIQGKHMVENIRRGTPQYSISTDDGTTDDVTDFSTVYYQHRLAIYRYILARVGHIEDSQDLTAQVFLKAYQNAASYRRETAIVYWLIGIARHQIIDYYRRKRTDVSLSDASEIPTPAPSLEDSLEQRERLRRVSEALNVLSEDRREALSMRLFAGLSNPEIAEIMGKSADAVAMLVHRGLQDLKNRLGEELL